MYEVEQVFMSKKTKNIYKEIDDLQKLQVRISNIGEDLGMKIQDAETEALSREIENIQYEMDQSLKNLKFWIDSLYAYNGKSTSNAKQASSRENGKKGGRPKKDISLMKARISELGDLIPEIEHRLRLIDDLDEENELRQKLETYETEKNQLEKKLEERLKQKQGDIVKRVKNP